MQFRWPGYCLSTRMENKKGRFYIGTSNIVVPGNRETYPPEYNGKSRLNYYSSFFNSLEVNSSFYKIPMQRTFEKWSMDVPPGFEFTVKLYKEITHIRELTFDPVLIDRFLDAAEGLSDKKGCLLIQFPGKISLDYYNNVEALLERIDQHKTNNKWRIAVEFRNDSWYSGETFELMDAHGASIVMHDIPKGRNKRLNKKASFVFKRFHGPTGDYRGSYTDEQLRLQANEIAAFLKQGKNVYAYFNNTIGEAFNNAIVLKSMVDEQ